MQTQLDSAAGANVWVDDQEAPVDSASFASSMAPGRHSITLRIDKGKRQSDAIKVEFKKPAGSTAEFIVVGGR